MTEAAVSDFDWALVRSFLAVLDAGSVSAAAKRSGARQPTLSRHVAELEAQLGAPLFERTGRGVVPTAAALAIVDASRRMQEAALAFARPRPSASTRRSRSSWSPRTSSPTCCVAKPTSRCAWCGRCSSR